MLGISAEVRQGAGVAGGDEVDIELVLDRELRVVTVPADFAAALTADDEARRFFDGLSYSNQRRFVESIAGAKAAETRARRIASSVEKLRGPRLTRRLRPEPVAASDRAGAGLRGDRARPSARPSGRPRRESRRTRRCGSGDRWARCHERAIVRSRRDHPQPNGVAVCHEPSIDSRKSEKARRSEAITALTPAAPGA